VDVFDDFLSYMPWAHNTTPEIHKAGWKVWPHSLRKKAIAAGKRRFLKQSGEAVIELFFGPSMYLMDYRSGN